MMYQSGFVVVVKDEKGKVLREKNNNGQRNYGMVNCPSVYLPFYSHYSLLLKNNNDRTAVAEIYIDGTEVISNKRIIVPAKSSVTVERFCIDGDLNSGKKFYFVPKEDGRVADPTNKENGLVEVRFRLEEKLQINNDFVYPTQPFYAPIHESSNWNVPNRTIRTKSMGIQQGNEWYNQTIGSSVAYNSTSNCFDSLSCSSASAGATVEGSQSNQKFVTASVGTLESSVTTIKIKIEPLPTNNKEREKEIESLKQQIKEFEKKLKQLEI